MLDTVADKTSLFVRDHPYLIMFICMILLDQLYQMWVRWPRTVFRAEKVTNIVITGGAQGLGCLLACQFLKESPQRSINIIVVDIRQDLAAALTESVSKAAGSEKVKSLHFYAANLADAKQTKETWEKIVKEHGSVHMLINNHAVCFGRRVDEMDIDRFKMTMDINFSSYVHLTMLFLEQTGAKDKKTAHQYHLVFMSSIAGHITCQRNSDYCASKFALNGFTGSLREELKMSGLPINMTIFYPYFINTGLFEGFQPRLRYIVPTLKAESTIKRIHEAIMAQEEEVFIDRAMFLFKLLATVLPLGIKSKIV